MNGIINSLINKQRKGEFMKDVHMQSNNLFHIGLSYMIKKEDGQNIYIDEYQQICGEERLVNYYYMLHQMQNKGE